MENLKWQIHAETSVTQIMLWIIIGKLFGDWVWGGAVVFILGNLFTIIKSATKLPKGYLNSSKENPNS